MPGWGMVTPWAMTSGDQFRQAGPPALDGPQYAKAYEEVKAIGEKNAEQAGLRTSEQTLIARFWMGGIPEHWHGVARTISEREEMPLLESARLFALLSIGLADASIAGWDMKYHFNFWRPVTAIYEGDDDMNTRTVGDVNWTPLLNTPPFPEYPSGHSTTCATAATVLSRFFQGKPYTFELVSTTPNLTEDEKRRTFKSFWQAAEEAGVSRIYAGVHFNFSNKDALQAGKKLGNFVYTNYLTKR
jgi:hypothetical protein